MCLSSVKRDPVPRVGSGNLCEKNLCCAVYPFSNSLTFPCPSAEKGFAGCQTTERCSYQAESLAASEPVKCAGSCEGAAVDNVARVSLAATIPCSIASASCKFRCWPEATRVRAACLEPSLPMVSCWTHHQREAYCFFVELVPTGLSISACAVDCTAKHNFEASEYNPSHRGSCGLHFTWKLVFPVRRRSAFCTLCTVSGLG